MEITKNRISFLKNILRPLEISFKEPPKKKLQRRVRVKRRIDPRFKDQYGDFNESHFRDNYRFIDEMQAKELKEIEDKLSSSKDNDASKSLKLQAIKLVQK